jgi:hypothetical protein
MTNEELLALATRIAKGRQRHFWSADRPHEKRMVKQTLEILKSAQGYGYEIIDKNN